MADNSARLNRADATFALMRDDSILEDPMSDAAMASVSNPDQDPLPHRGYCNLVEPVKITITHNWKIETREFPIIMFPVFRRHRNIDVQNESNIHVKRFHV